MTKKIKFLIFMFMITTNIFAYNNKFVPKAGKILLLIGQDKENIEEYINSVNITPAGFMVYTSIQNMEGLYSPVDYGAGINHLQFLVGKYPNTVIQIGLWMVGGLQGTINGLYDNNILKLATWAKSIDNPIYLRIGYEFDAPFNNYNPQLYINAYKYIVNKLRNYNVNNIAYVWHSYSANNNIDITKWYPGDEYVDWCGISYFHGVHSYLYPMRDFARNHKKPLMIAESTPQGMKVGVDPDIWDKWFKSFFEFIYDKNNNVQAISYINANWDIQPMWRGKNWGDTRIQKNNTIKTQWLNEINKDIFLNSSVALYDSLTDKSS